MRRFLRWLRWFCCWASGHPWTVASDYRDLMECCCGRYWITGPLLVRLYLRRRQ